MNMKTKCLTASLLAAWMVVFGTLAVAGSAEPAGAASNVSDRNSQVKIEGTATIYGNWACGGQASVQAIPGKLSEPVPGFPGGVQSTMVTVAVHAIDCGDGTMNKHLRKALKEKDFPEIHFQTEKYSLADNGGEVKAVGELTIAGVTKPVELDAKLTSLPQGGVRVVGKLDIQMLDYGVKPPSLLLGALRVANGVSVRFDTMIQPTDEVRQASASLESR